MAKMWSTIGIKLAKLKIAYGMKTFSCSSVNLLLLFNSSVNGCVDVKKLP